MKQTGRPYPLGVTTTHNETFFSAVISEGNDCGLILYDLKTGREQRIPFKKENKYGSIYSFSIENLDVERYAYHFYEGEKVFTDPYAKKIYGHEKWGKPAGSIKGGFLTASYDWENDHTLLTPYENSVLYCLNVRAFTMHKSSGVKNRGTFSGIIEKIPYFKEIGITGIELMPAYEFDEVEYTEPGMLTETYVISEVQKKRLNCWGYKEGYYFAPKASFCAGRDAAAEFKDMVRELHKNGIEVLMQFYFPKTVKQGLVMEVLKFWILEYHIDGIHLKGENIPLNMAATEPLFTDTKLLYDDFPYDEIYREQETVPYRNLASYNDDYMVAVRRFLKGDDNMLASFLQKQKYNPKTHGIINYITNYYGFSLFDMVSYEQKHNEANGEDNRDGSEYHYAWNCGAEGGSRKKSVLSLRSRQMKNALVMLILSAGTPLIYSGDEMGNTRFGNNNPYCQDNETGWIKWKEGAFYDEIRQFFTELVLLRKEHPILRKESEFKILDYAACGYPDLSYHGEEAWRPDLGNNSRFAGVMYCGEYADTIKGEEDQFFYAAYNMHWMPHTFALPHLKKGMNWHLLADTNRSGFYTAKERIVMPAAKEQHVVVPARTIHIYISQREQGYQAEKKKNEKRTAF